MFCDLSAATGATGVEAAVASTSLLQDGVDLPGCAAASFHRTVHGRRVVQARRLAAEEHPVVDGLCEDPEDWCACLADLDADTPAGALAELGPEAELRSLRIPCFAPLLTRARRGGSIRRLADGQVHLHVQAQHPRRSRRRPVAARFWGRGPLRARLNYAVARVSSV